ncbi:hexosaminidase [Luteibacter rhizovicinus]|uniref:beta-N-acetylhexosaminidase n=1 Tax=Luteibacter rhizovicinus TaxID=242606 RepID=A0A4R3YKP6_9GAMM|nr:family 20 glycosylhydrolase [Luteibacter rhizovicinus]TCV92771.1 hexosaminidase [Luteibacter rhizovicinus]
MRHRSSVRFALLALTAVLGACASQPKPASLRPVASEQTPLSLLPQPAHLDRLVGQFPLGANTHILIPAGRPDVRHVAEQLARLIKSARGFDLAIVEGGPDTGAISLIADPSVKGEEAYTLDVDGAHVRIAASDMHGMYYGAVTLWQLATDPSARDGVPAVRIVDAPRFAWRGLMLDSGRHFQSVDDIKHLLDQMALHKLNTFHWHLTDDQGWRLEIKRYPKLTSVGGCRAAVGPDAQLTGGSDKPYCGFYTQAQARDIVVYAADRHIVVVPEIEMPGHAQAAIAAYPELGVTGKKPNVSTDWGVNTWLYSPDEKTIAFLQNVMDEVMDVFPSTYIHVGGDEAAKDQWEHSKAVQAQMRKLGIDDYEKLQGWFIARIGTYLDQHHRRLIGWDEILDGDVPASATVMSWRGVKGAIKAANQGHDVVLAPSPTLYTDYLQSDLPSEQPGRPQIQTLRSVYDFEPVPADIAADKASHVLGAQVTVFSEYLPTWQRTQHAIFPRVAALAELTWSPKGDWNSFIARLPAQFDRYREAGIMPADSAYAVRVDVAPTVPGKARVTLANQSGYGTIRYTTDGSAPMPQSTGYEGPFEVAIPVTVRANAFANGFGLAGPRERAIDAASLARRTSDELDTCGNKLTLRLGPVSPDSPHAIYKVDIMNTCWQWKGAVLDGKTAVDVTIDRLPYNYQLWKDAAGVVGRKMSTRNGEFEIRKDSCDGERLATLPLPRDSRATLHAKLPAVSGTHDLCLFFTGKPEKTFRVLGDIQLR